MSHLQAGKMLECVDLSGGGSPNINVLIRIRSFLTLRPLPSPPNGLRGSRYATSPGLERLPYRSGPAETSQPQISPETTQTGSDFPEKTQPGLPAGKPLRDPRGNPDRTLAGESLTRAVLRGKSQPNRRLGAKGRLPHLSSIMMINDEEAD